MLRMNPSYLGSIELPLHGATGRPEDVDHETHEMLLRQADPEVGQLELALLSEEPAALHVL